MISFHPFILLLFTLQEQLPYKPSSEFEINVDYKFQERPAIDRTKVEYEVATDERNRKAISGPLPYLKLQLKLVAMRENEQRIRVINSNGDLVFNRKAAPGTVLKFDIGFIDDVKDRINPHEFNIYLLSDNKKKVSWIHLLILEDGTFLINNEVRGKF
jgi:hypothetical protein